MYKMKYTPEQMDKLITKYKHAHPFHLVTASPWPFFTSFAVFLIALAFLEYLAGIPYSGWMLLFTLITLIVPIAGWFRDIVIESSYQGHHTKLVYRGLRIGMILFIVSEAMFFFSLFWTFLHSSLSPAIQIGGIWPPKGIQVLDYKGIPLLNTLILLNSGAFVTWAHVSFNLPEKYSPAPYLGPGYHEDNSVVISQQHNSTSEIVTINFPEGLPENKSKLHAIGRINVFWGLLMAIVLGIIFTLLQFYEYCTAPFSISDGIYGSIFYMATGFHGLHVIIGTIFLSVCLGLHYNYHFFKTRHFAFEAAAWYWHFVDIIWLLLYLLIYCWGS